MKNRTNHWLSMLALALAAVFSTSVSAATLADIYQVAKIDALTEETRQLLNQYKTVLKQIEGLRVYNRQLEKQISGQRQEMEQLASSIDEVTIIERQITPLMLRMIEGLDQFVGLDLPFLLDERYNRIDLLREMMDRADVAVSEKFSQVLRAFQIENEYGRTMETYADTIDLGGVDRKVDVLKVGRVSLVYQTPDGEETGMWNQGSRAWEPLGDEYTTPVRNGIRMARKQLSVDMLTLPITGPEA